MVRERPAIPGGGWSTNGPLIKSGVECLYDLRDVLDETLEVLREIRERLPATDQPVAVSEPAPAGAVPPLVAVSEPAPAGAPLVGPEPVTPEPDGDVDRDEPESSDSPAGPPARAASRTRKPAKARAPAAAKGDEVKPTAKARKTAPTKTTGTRRARGSGDQST